MSKNRFSWNVPAKGEVPKTPDQSMKDVDDKGLTNTGESNLLKLCTLYENEFGITFCGGAIGASGRMCIRKDCLIAKHALSKAKFPKNGACLFIPALSNMPDLSMVHLDPVISEFDVSSSRFKKFQTEERSIDHWELLFNVILNGQEEGMKAAEALTTKDGPLSNTPVKKRKTISYEAHTSSEAWDSSIALPAADLGSDGDVITNLQQEWSTLVIYLNGIKELCDSVHSALSSALPTIWADFSELDLITHHLKGQIGARPKDLDLKPVFEHLRQLNESSNNLHRRVERVSSSCDATYKELDNLGDDLMNSMQPVIDFMCLWSSDKLTPGDKLEDRLGNLDKRVDDVKKALAAAARFSQASITNKVSAQPSNPSQSSWSLSRGDNYQVNPLSANLTTPASSSSSNLDVQRLISEVTALQNRVKGLEDQAVSQCVEMGGISFRSLHDTEAWVVQNIDPGDFFVFSDAHALLNVGMEEASTNTEVLTFEAAATKSGYTSSTEALVSASFKLELPPFFGSESKAKNSRELPQSQNF